MKRGLCLTLAVLTLLLCTACGPSRTASDSEEARDAAREEPAAVVPALTRSLPVAEALQRGAVQSILVIGDSISDGNTDDGCVWGSALPSGGLLVLHLEYLHPGPALRRVSGDPPGNGRQHRAICPVEQIPALGVFSGPPLGKRRLDGLGRQRLRRHHAPF